MSNDTAALLVCLIVVGLTIAAIAAMIAASLA